MADAPPDDLPYTLREFREALSDRFLAQRPSFDRCVRRLMKRSPEMAPYFERSVYEPLMADIRRLEALLKEAAVDEDQFEVERYTVNSWSPGNFQVKAHLRRKDPDGEVAAAPPPTSPWTSRVRPLKKSPVELLAIPDIHFGWTCSTELGPDGVPFLRWEPIHDPLAVAVVLAVAEHLQPREIVVLGDTLDLPGLGKWDTSPAQRHQTLSAVQAGRQFYADLRGACPDARIVMLEGNHERRWKDYLARNAPEMTWAPNVPSMLGLSDDSARVEYVGPYRMKAPVLGDGRTFATHGELIGRTGGESAAKMLKTYPTQNSIFGHTHRLELAWHTEWSARNEPSLFWSMGCGTLARLDNAVPGSMLSDWQQGFGVVVNGRPEAVPIHQGTCTLLGRTYSARTAPGRK